MMMIRIVPSDTNIQFINKRFIAMALSAFLVVASLGLYMTKGLNLGIDFLGGIMLEVKTKGAADIGDLRSRVSGLGLGDVSLQEFGEPDVVLIRVQRQEGGDNAQQAAVTKVIAEGTHLTADLGGKASTQQMGDAIAAAAS